MNCHEATDVLEMYIAGELPESESLDVVAHLATCDECAAEYERLRVLIGGMRGIADSFVPVERFTVPAPTIIARRAGWGWRARHRCGGACGGGFGECAHRSGARQAAACATRIGDRAP